MSRRLHLVVAGALAGGLFLALSFPIDVAGRLGGAQRHFFAQAEAWLAGRLTIPLASGIAELVPVGSAGEGAIAYPPAPAIAALPLVAVGLPTEIGARLLSAAAFLLVIALAHRLVRARGVGGAAAATIALSIAIGSGLWFLAAVPSSWYLAQLVGLAAGLGALLAGSRRPFLAGLLLALSLAARLPVGVGVGLLLGIELLRARRFTPLVLAMVGTLPPLLGWAAFNLARFGTPFDNGYARIPGVTEEPWFRDGIISLSYLPRSLEALVLRGPGLLEGRVVPDIGGMSLLLVAPAVVLLFAAFWRPTSTTPLGSVATIVALLPGLLHGSWGFTQLGYRFAYDALPGALLLAVGAAAPLSRHRALVAGIVVAGIALNVWAYVALADGAWTFRGM